MGRGGKSALNTASLEPPDPARGPEGLRGGGGEAPAVRKPSRAAGWRPCGSIAAGTERGGPAGLRERGSEPLIYCGNAGGVLALLYVRSRSPAFCHLFGFFSYRRSPGFGRPVKSSWDNGVELGVRRGGALSGGAPSVGKMHRHEVLW